VESIYIVAQVPGEKRWKLQNPLLQGEGKEESFHSQEGPKKIGES